MSIAIYTLTSELHNKQQIEAATSEFLGSLSFDYVFKDSDYTDFGQHALNLIFVRTGGTEGVFERMLPTLPVRTFYLLTSGKSNSLAASMEILSYLRQNGYKGEIIHGSAQYVSRRIMLLARIGEARQQLSKVRLGVIGQPSDWLISSHADRHVVKENIGVDLVDIPMHEMQEILSRMPATPMGDASLPSHINASLPGANQIYKALRIIVDIYRLQGFTLRCFDLLNTMHNTGCMALAQLNAEGYVAGCEGDVPAMLSMMIARTLFGVSGFLANPAHIDPDTGEILFAHCTIPLDMVERYELDTHFESGIGIGIRGYMKEGPVTIFKVSGDLSRHFVAEGMLVRNEGKPGLCRTQQVIQLADPAIVSYFLTEPIGNHHIILPGHHQEVLQAMF